MDSNHVAISISQSESQVEPTPSPTKEEKKLPKTQYSLIQKIVSYVREKTSNKHDMRRLIHSTKVGFALVLVSFIYLLDPIFEQVGENAMWAIMTVVVIFEFYAGATLGKGLNRGIGTILGGGLGCLAAYCAQQVGGTGDSIIVAASVFIFGAGATYTRLVPRIKKRYDYGVMIFILTFSLVAVSGMRAETVLKVAKERLSTIGMGFAVCVFISLMVFPTWASDELHDSTASNFQNLANSLQGCMEDYFRLVSEKENEPSASRFSSCKSVLNSKAKDEQLANFAKWEPWHGKFGLYYPWGKYLKIGELLRELAASVVSLKHCVQSTRQPSSTSRQSIREQCEAVGSSLAWSFRELGDSIKKMKKCQQAEVIGPKMKAVRVELSSVVLANSGLGQLENVEMLGVASFVFLLMEMVEKIEVLAKEVEELGELAGFRSSVH